MQRDYGGVIWTNHAMERMSQRGLSQHLALQVLQQPDSSHAGKQPGSFEYIKAVQGHKITLITKQTERGEWLVVSLWVDPPFPGSIDEKKKHKEWAYRKASWWKKILLGIKDQLGF